MSDHPSVTEAPVRAAADPTLDRFDRDIVEFLLRWNPYGGPPDDEVMPPAGGGSGLRRASLPPR